MNRVRKSLVQVNNLLNTFKEPINTYKQPFNNIFMSSLPPLPSLQVADQAEFQKRCLKYTWCVVLQCGGHRGGKNCKKRETDGRWEALMEAHRRVQVRGEEEKRRGSVVACGVTCVVPYAAVVCGSGVL